MAGDWGLVRGAVRACGGAVGGVRVRAGMVASKSGNLNKHYMHSMNGSHADGAESANASVGHGVGLGGGGGASGREESGGVERGVDQKGSVEDVNLHGDEDGVALWRQVGVGVAWRDIPGNEGPLLVRPDGHVWGVFGHESAAGDVVAAMRAALCLR